MKKVLILFLFLSTNVFAEINLTKIKDGLNSPWSLSIVDDGKYLITEKPGNIILFNEVKNTSKIIKHNLDEKFNGAWTMYEMTMPNDIKIVGDCFPTMQKGGRFMTLAISKKNLMSKEGL